MLRLLKEESPQEVARELGLGMATLYGRAIVSLKPASKGLKYGGRSRVLHDAEKELKQAPE